MTAILIDNITIRQDEESRFCLKDLHRAAEEDPNQQPAASSQQPAFFLRRAETAQLITKLNSANSQIKSVTCERGRYGGTFLCAKNWSTNTPCGSALSSSSR